VLQLARALRREAAALEDAGAPIIQFDEPSIVRSKGEFSLFEEAMFTLTEDLRGKKVLCTYFGDVEGLTPRFFQLPFEVFGLDFVMGPRNYAVLGDLPRDRELSAGLLDARNTKMESVEEIVAKLGRIGEFVPFERLSVQPSCGLDFLPRQNAYDKLVRMVEAVKVVDEAASSTGREVAR
jgi:5-methyltetrahydropteroyltriglutamate--homocysteine methyltransferase